MHPLRASLIAHKSACRSILGVEELGALVCCSRQNSFLLLLLLRSFALARSAENKQQLRGATRFPDVELGHELGLRGRFNTDPHQAQCLHQLQVRSVIELELLGANWR